MIIHARASAFLDSFKMLKAGRKTTEKTEGQIITPFSCSSCSKMRKLFHEHLVEYGVL